MRRHRALIAVAGAALLVGSGCGGSTAEGEFDALAAEEFIRNKARADVQSNPALQLQEPQEPEVTCEEKGGGAPEDETQEAASYTCEVMIVDADGAPLGQQTWAAELELDSTTGDTVVRSSRRVDSSITPAPIP